MSDSNHGAKRFRTESPALLSPLPLPRSVRWCVQIAPAVFKLASLSLPRTTLMVPCAIIVPASVHLWIPAYFDDCTLVGAGVPDGPHRFSFMPTVGIFRTPMDAPRRGRRPRRPASFLFHASGGDISRSGATSFCPRRQKDAKTPPKTHGLWNSFRPLAITVQKGSAPNRPHSYPRCRSCVPRENFLLPRRTGEVLYILHNFVFCGPKGHTYLSQSAGKRHPFPRPAFERPQWAHPAHTYLAMSPVAHPVGAGVPDGPYRRTLEYRRTLVYPSVGAGVPDGPFSVLRLRVAPASCMYASGGHISFNSERNMEKNAAKNRRFLDFPFVQL